MAQEFDLDKKIGAALVGCVVSSTLFGIIAMQIYRFIVIRIKDALSFQILVYFLWVLTVTQMLLSVTTVYLTTVTGYGDVVTLLYPPKTFLSQVFISTVSDAAIRCIFAWKVNKITKSKLLSALIVLASFVYMGFGIAYASVSFGHTFVSLSKNAYMLYASFAAALAGDLIIVGALCTDIWRITQSNKTIDIVDKVRLYAINTCLLTTVWTAVCLITFAVWPTEYVYIGVYYSLNKLYMNSLLATLNNRPPPPRPPTRLTAHQHSLPRDTRTLVDTKTGIRRDYFE